MPVFELEVNGQKYEVEAASAEEAANAFKSVQAPSSKKVPGFFEQFAESEIAQAEAAKLAGTAIAAGVPEGLRTIAGGAKQVAGGLGDALQMFVHGKAYRGPDVRLPDGTIIRGGDLESSQHKQATANEILRQVNQKQEWIEQGVNPEHASQAAAGTELAVLSAVPEAIGPRATTMVGAGIRNMLTGAAGVGVQFDADDSKADDVAAAAILGPVLGSAPSVIPAVKNAVGRAVSAAANNPRVKQAYDNARRTLKRTDYTLAQVTQDPQLIALERAAFDAPLVEFHAKQMDNFELDFVEALRKNIPPGTKLGNEFVQTRVAMDGALKAMQTNASKMYDEGMAEAARLADRVQTPQGVPGRRAPETFNQGPPAKVTDIETARARRAPRPAGAQIPTPDFANQAKAVFEDARRVQAAGPKPLREAWMRQTESRLAKGYLTARETADLLKDLSGLSQAKGPAKAYAGKLRRALDGDLNLVEQNAGAAADDSVRMILDTRKAYSVAKLKIKAMEEEAVYKLMGVSRKGQESLTSDQLLDRFKTIGPERQVEVRNWMRDHNPELLDGLRNDAINDAVARAKQPLNPAAESRFDFEALDKALVGEKGVFRTAGLWDKTEGEALNDVRDGLRLIVSHSPRLTKGPGTVNKAEDVAINLVARHAGFLTRQATRLFMSTKASRFFTDPSIRAAIMKVNRTTTGTPANLTARAALLAYMQDMCGEECYESAPEAK